MKTHATSPKNEAEGQLAECIDKFTPEMANAIRAVRAALRKRLPTANHLYRILSLAVFLYQGIGCFSTYPSLHSNYSN